jgi:hypothetical protein
MTDARRTIRTRRRARLFLGGSVMSLLGFFRPLSQAVGRSSMGG